MRRLRESFVIGVICKKAKFMQQSLKARFHGVAPLLMNTGRTANPLDQFAKALKQISQKRHKTDADFEEMYRLEWYGGLYLSHGKPCIPGLVMDACLVDAAKKVRKGKQANAGLFSAGEFVIEHDGPDDIDSLWEDERFSFSATVRIQRSRIIRMRPKFSEWAADLEICFDDRQLNEQDIREFLSIAGRDVGLMDWRPRFGRFEIV